MSTSSRGSYRERALAVALTDAGWIVYRAAGSHGNADLVALKVDRAPLLVQVKGSAAGPFDHFGPGDRSALAREARLAGAEAFLAWAPGRQPVRWYMPPEWAPCESPL